MIAAVIRKDVNLTHSSYRVLEGVTWAAGAVCSQCRILL